MPDYETLTLGQDGQVVIIIDDFHPDFETLKSGVRHLKFARGAKHYPGLQASFDPAYLGFDAERLTAILREVFDMKSGAAPVQCAASMVTTPPDQLSIIQRLPHFDTTDPGRVALLHYLDGDAKGGTGFYRQRATGFEYVDQARYPQFVKTLENSPAAYMSGSDKRYEKIAAVEAKPNRLILYRSFNLHSGDIPKTLDLAPNPETARLTINTFFQGR